MTVYLVGAGPGDPGLMTARSLELIAAADVIVYDRLIPASALEGARPGATLIYAGKEAGGPSMPQEEITRRWSGTPAPVVVRLKGGDPFVFGRGARRPSTCVAAGLGFEVVPGCHRRRRRDRLRGDSGHPPGRRLGRRVRHRPRGPSRPSSALDWGALAAFPGTLVVYMGVRQLPAIAAQLIAHGRAESELVAVVERGTLPSQGVVSGTLATIASVVADAGVRAPALVIVGAVAGLREGLRWFESRPLAGLSVAVTRARAQSSVLAGRLLDLGADVVQAPAIRIVPLDGPALSVAGYDLVCVTSPNGSRLLFERLAAGGLDARALAGARVAAIGPGTAAALRAHGVIADVVPERFVAEGLVEALEGVSVKRALVARAAEARDVLPDALRERGAEVDVVALYETVAEPLDQAALEAVAGADYVTFTSSSTVRFLFSSAGDLGSRLRGRLVSIGPVTSETLREHGLEPDVEATRHDIDGLVEALVADASRARAAT